jgi:uncharacterized membrane protein
MSIPSASSLELAMEHQPSHDECAFAFLAEFLQIFAGFVAPITILIVKRDSRFVMFHALQALFWHVVWIVVWIGAIVFWFLFFIRMIPHMTTQPPNTPPSPHAFMMMFEIWGVMILGFIVNFIVGVVMGTLAYRGKWSRIPLIGRLAMAAARN